MKNETSRQNAFTLIELLVVIAIIAILAGIGFAGISGAMRTARKAEVRAMLNQTKLAVIAYYSDYGIYPSNKSGLTDADFLRTMIGSNVTVNRRGIRYLDAAAKWTNNDGLVTPKKFYKTGQSNFVLVMDTNYDGSIEVKNATDGNKTNLNGSVALYIKDPDNANGYITTY